MNGRHVSGGMIAFKSNRKCNFHKNFMREIFIRILCGGFS
jgi:hypothetical protein